MELRSRQELELEAEKLFPITEKMCVWKRAEAEWKRKEWVKGQMITSKDTPEKISSSS